MKRATGITIAVLAIAVVGFGYYNGWFDTEPNNNALPETMDRAELISAYKDSIRPVTMMMAAQSQSYRMKNDSSFSGISFNEVRFSADTVSSNGLKAITSHGLYVITDRSGEGFNLSIHLKPMIDGDIHFDSETPEPLRARVKADHLTWFNLKEDEN